MGTSTLAVSPLAHPVSRRSSSRLAAPQRLPAVSPRGPLSEAVLLRLTSHHGDLDVARDSELLRLAGRAVEAAERRGAAERSSETKATTHSDGAAANFSIATDDDVQVTLFLLYASAYGSLQHLRPDLEWNAGLIEIRQVLERAFEAELGRGVIMPELPTATSDAVARALFDLTASDARSGLTRFIAKRATIEQIEEFLKQRSIYTLREADPHSWAIPRLSGRSKAALVEIQSDEYGGGRPDRVHAELFAAAIRGAGLDDTYGAYVNEAPALTLASHNMMSMFGLNRRLLGAIVGHLAAFEMTSSIPNKMYSDGLRRLGFGDDVIEYFDEHVEADAVHEQIAGRDLAGALAEDQPGLLPDILFGAAACLTIDGLVGAQMHEAWSRGVSSLRSGVAR